MTGGCEPDRRRQHGSRGVLLNKRALSLIMLKCPSCKDANPENLSVDISLGGYFLNDLLADRAPLEAIKEYVMDALYVEHSHLDCNACGYSGPWVAGEYCSDPGHTE